MSPRRLRVLIQGLPPESATMTAIRNANPDEIRGTGADPTKGSWSQDNMLRATLIDEFRMLRWVYECAHMPKNKRPDPPEPIPRPGVEPRRKKKQQLSATEYDWLFRHINGIDQDDGSEFTSTDVQIKPIEQMRP